MQETCELIEGNSDAAIFFPLPRISLTCGDLLSTLASRLPFQTPTTCKLILINFSRHPPAQPAASETQNPRTECELGFQTRQLQQSFFGRLIR